jgi:hypothetical protein
MITRTSQQRERSRGDMPPTETQRLFNPFALVSEPSPRHHGVMITAPIRKKKLHNDLPLQRSRLWRSPNSCHRSALGRIRLQL